MTTVIITIIAVVQVIALFKWIERITDLEDNLWIEPTIIVVGILFQILFSSI